MILYRQSHKQTRKTNSRYRSKTNWKKSDCTIRNYGYERNKKKKKKKKERKKRYDIVASLFKNFIYSSSFASSNRVSETVAMEETNQIER